MRTVTHRGDAPRRLRRRPSTLKGRCAIAPRRPPAALDPGASAAPDRPTPRAGQMACPRGRAALPSDHKITSIRSLYGFRGVPDHHLRRNRHPAANELRLESRTTVRPPVPLAIPEGTHQRHRDLAHHRHLNLGRHLGIQHRRHRRNNPQRNRQRRLRRRRVPHRPRRPRRIVRSGNVPNSRRSPHHGRSSLHPRHADSGRDHSGIAGPGCINGRGAQRLSPNSNGRH